MDNTFPRFFSHGRSDPADRRFALIFNYCALLGAFVHAVLIPAFGWLGLGALSSFNVASTALWVTALILNRHGYYRSAITLVLAEVTAHSSLAVAELGYASGFAYYLFLAPPLVFFSPLGTREKLLLIGFAGLLLLSLQSLNAFGAPTHPLDDAVLATLRGANIAIVFGVLAGMSYYYHRIAIDTEADLQHTNTELQRLAGTDPLTGLINRRKMLEELEHEVERFQRNGKTFSVLLGDIDNFKRINDEFGHEVGDQVLRHVSDTMSELTRQMDRLARWGGEEFLILCPETDQAGAFRVADKIRHALSERPLHQGGKTLSVTMTFGTSVFVPGDSLDSCIVRADHALYRGKEIGKNRVVMG